MDVEEKRLLNEALELSRENNKMLRSLHRSMVWGRVYRVMYWLIALGLALGAFYFLQPYIEQFQTIWGDVQRGIKGGQDLLNQFSSPQG